MTTFSQLVDKMVAETKRPDMATEMATYLNQTLRELHMEPSRGNAIFFKDNRLESQLTATADTGFYWDLPSISTWQGMEAVQYPNAPTRACEPIYAREMAPGKAMNRLDHFWYRAGPRVFFNCYGGINALINLSYYQYTKSLTYYISGSRPAIYDESTGWTYADAYNTSDAQRALAQAMTTNWLLLRWPMVIEEGLRAKVYKRLSDTDRSRTSYSMYQTLRQGLYSAEVGDVTGSW